MNAARTIAFAIALAGLGCGGRTVMTGPSLKACRIYPGAGIEIASIDGERVEMVNNYWGRGKDYAESAPGRHAVTFTQGRAKRLTLTFLCRPSGSYHLDVGKVPGDIYGDRTVWSIEDGKTRKIVASGSP